MKSTLLLFFFFTIVFGAAGQRSTGAVLSGSVYDEQGKAIEFAAVVLLPANDSTRILQATVTDTAGGFRFAGVLPGRFRVKTSYVGHRAVRSVELTVLPSTQTLPVGVLTAVSVGTALQEVVVQGERPIAERSLGKVTLNVNNSFFKTAPNALEVLRRAPGLQVDPLGAITIRGTTTPVVYVEGRQVPLSAEELAALSAEDMEQVEIMANASSRYDGTTRAVINIKLKRDKTLGLKASTYATGTVNRKYAGYDAGVSGTYKTRKWAYYGRVGYNRINNFTRLASQRVVQGPDGSRTVLADASFLHSRLAPISYQGEVAYSITKNHTVSVYIKGLSRHSTDATTNLTEVRSQPPAGQPGSFFQLPSTTAGVEDFSNTTVDVGYKGTLSAAGDALTVNVTYARFTNAQTQDFRTQAGASGLDVTPFPRVLLGNFPTTTRIAAWRSDYSKPFSKTVSSSFGAKMSTTATDNELQYDTLSVGGAKFRDASRSNRFLYKEWVTAAYGGIALEKGRNSVDAVLRAEFTQSTGTSVTLDQVTNRRYYNWLPSLQAQHKFNEQNVLGFAFSRKMQRPSFYELNPFQFYLTPYSYSEGNPFLLPAIVSRTELSYTYKDVTFSAEYELIRNQVAQLPIQDAQTKVLRYTQANLDQVRNVVFSASSPLTLTKWWKMQHTLAVYHSQTLSPFEGGFIDNRAWTLLANGQQTFSLPASFTLGLGYNFTSPGASEIYQTKSSGTVSLSLQKPLLHGKGNLQIAASDLFNTYREAAYGRYQGIDVNTLQTRSVQQAYARFTYRFGSSTYNRNGRSLGSAEEEKRASK